MDNDEMKKKLQEALGGIADEIIGVKVEAEALVKGFKDKNIGPRKAMAILELAANITEHAILMNEAAKRGITLEQLERELGDKQQHHVLDAMKGAGVNCDGALIGTPDGELQVVGGEMPEQVFDKLKKFVETEEKRRIEVKELKRMANLTKPGNA